jgi:hypothetical protein
MPKVLVERRGVLAIVAAALARAACSSTAPASPPVDTDYVGSGLILHWDGTSWNRTELLILHQLPSHLGPVLNSLERPRATERRR